MEAIYGNTAYVKYNSSEGLLRARLFLDTPDLKTELENMISSSFKDIGNSDKKESITHSTTTYFLREEPSLKKPILEQLRYTIKKVFSKNPEEQKQERKPICTVLCIHDRSQGMPRLDVEVNLPDSNTNREIIQNLGVQLEVIYKNTQKQYLPEPSPAVQHQ